MPASQLGDRSERHIGAASTFQRRYGRLVSKSEGLRWIGVAASDSVSEAAESYVTALAEAFRSWLDRRPSQSTADVSIVDVDQDGSVAVAVAVVANLRAGRSGIATHVFERRDSGWQPVAGSAGGSAVAWTRRSEGPAIEHRASGAATLPSGRGCGYLAVDLRKDVHRLSVTGEVARDLLLGDEGLAAVLTDRRASGSLVAYNSDGLQVGESPIASILRAYA